MDITALIIAFLVSVSVFVLYLVLSAVFKKKEDYNELRSRIAPDGSEYNNQGQNPDDPFTLQHAQSPLVETMASLVKITGANIEAKHESLKKLFITAGINNPDATVYYLFYQRIVSILLLVVAVSIMLRPASGADQLMNLMMGGMIAILAVFGPTLYLKNARQKRAQILTRSFPDALDLILVCVESGLALDAALNRVCRELGKAHPLVTEELNRTRLELAMLNDRSQALINLAERTDLVPFRSLTAALIQTEKFGTSITDTLRVLSEDYRNTRLLLAEQKAGKIPALITLPLIMMLLPALFLLILGPLFIRISQQGGILGGG